VIELAPKKQIAALPLRKKGKVVEILLISSRETKRWIIPKGWPMQGRTDDQAAQQEAFEEAGVEGRMGTTPIGSFAYTKRKKSGKLQPCDVTVYALTVEKLLRQWPEKAERKRRWFKAKEAAELVTEEGLRAIILATLT
jgi:8-oxo-dGTP pyrophosphatase MutT (NUDIX family)